MVLPFGLEVEVDAFGGDSKDLTSSRDGVNFNLNSQKERIQTREREVSKIAFYSKPTRMEWNGLPWQLGMIRSNLRV